MKEDNQNAWRDIGVSHEDAVKAISDCSASVTVLSYREAIEGYLKLRGIEHNSGEV